VGSGYKVCDLHGGLVWGGSIHGFCHVSSQHPLVMLVILMTQHETLEGGRHTTTCDVNDVCYAIEGGRHR
jgi:hypothetical protein